MPALITHYLFGEAAQQQLPELSGLSDEESWAHLVGNQGPDPFFFNWRSPLQFVSTSRLGSNLHSSHMSAFFDELRVALDRLPEQDRSIGRAFALGMLGHYALDRLAHPFIYAQQYMIVDLGRDMEKSESKVHALVESDLDSMMLWRYHKRNVEQEHPASCLTHTKRIGRVAGVLVAQAARVALGTAVDPSLYPQALGAMERFYQLSEPAGNPLSGVVGKLERLASKDSLVQALGHKIVFDDSCPWANEAHAFWTHPFSGQDSNDSFQNRFDFALEDYKTLVRDFLNGTPAASLTRHIDYSGCELDADEHASTKAPVRPWQHR